MEGLAPMPHALFRFYGELNDLLPPARRGAAFLHRFDGAPAVKDAIEALGVPHPEVDLVLAGGEPVDFAWRLRDGARVSVYPRFAAIDVGGVTRVRPPPLPGPPRFALDAHLGRLARHLRTLGVDATWTRDVRDEELARAAAAEGRVVLTRDVGLLERSAVVHGRWLRETDPARQLAEVVRRFGLARAVAPFTRCLCCNTPLAAVDDERVLRRVPPRVRERHGTFRSCPSCGRVYWAGSHARRMERLVDDVLAAAGAAPAPSPAAS